MMQLSHPEWFLFLLVWVLIAWRMPWLKLFLPRRVAMLACIFLAWAGLEIKMPDRSLNLWVLLDKSDSARELTLEGEAEWLELIQSKQPENSQLHRVEFGATVQDKGQEAQAFPEERGGESQIAGALEHVLFRADPSESHRVIVFSDGYATDRPARLEQALRSAGIVVEYRWLTPEEPRDAWIAELKGPQTAQLREAVVIEGRILGPENETVTYQLLRDAVLINEGQGVLQEGGLQLRFADRPPSGGSYRYSLKIDMEGDATPGNNEKSYWMRVADAPRVLILSSYRNDPIVATLQNLGFPVDLALPDALPDAGKLTAYRAVILHNIGAPTLGNAFLEDLRYWVETQGGGLMMVGGNRSFGTGGYFESPIDSILPVSMESREDHKRLAVAMAIVMDRSGSMGAAVSNGMTKMDLANVGAAAAADLLSDYDALTVFAVDSEAHTVVPLTQIGPHRDQIVRRVRSITSMGGGIFVYNGLLAAWDQLKKSPAGQRHIILFSDAADSEQPDQYKALIQEMRAEKTTVSVIALGTEQDADAAFLRDIAERGEGRIFFNTDPSALPAVFSQETVAVARSAFVEEYVKAQGFPAWLELAQTDLAWPEIIYGYNLSYLREGASLAAHSLDEYKAPLVAFWRVGAGRSAAITFPMAGQIGSFNQGWSGLPELVVTLTRWLQGESQPEGLRIQSRLSGNVWDIDLYYDATWTREIDKKLPSLFTRTVGSSEGRAHNWTRISSERLRASIKIPAGHTQTGAVQVGDFSLMLGPVSSGTDAEWQRSHSSRQRFETLASATGGQARLRLDRIWETDTKIQWVPLKIYLLLAALLILLYDAFLTRIGSWKVLFRKG